MFITFEGIEGCGKTTQLMRFAKYLEGLDHKICLTREPGGTNFGEAVREILLDKRFSGMSNLSELYLYTAARCQHVNEVIKPALAKGDIVLCDRYGDATRAYQIGGRNIERKIVNQVHEWAVDGCEPALTFLIDCPVEIGLARARKRSLADRIEAEKHDFHERVRQEYLNIAESEPRRVILIDGTMSEDEVWNKLMLSAKERIKCLNK